MAGKRRKRNRNATEQALIAAAAELFSFNGFDATTTREIARNAGVSEALIPRYFGSKEGLFKVVYQRALDLLGEYAPEIGTETQETWLDVFLESCLNFWSERPEIERDILRSVLSRSLFDRSIGRELGMALQKGPIAKAHEQMESRFPGCGTRFREASLACVTDLMLVGFSQSFLAVTGRDKNAELARLLARGLRRVSEDSSCA